MWHLLLHRSMIAIGIIAAIFIGPLEGLRLYGTLSTIEDTTLHAREADKPVEPNP